MHAVPDRDILPVKLPWIQVKTARARRPVDRHLGWLYIAPEVGNRAKTERKQRNQTVMSGKSDNMDLAALEARVDELIRTVSQLTTENSALRTQQDHLVGERATLIEKTEQARTRIESMISRLRAMETRT